MLNLDQKQRHQDFNAAKKLAFNMPSGCYRRAANTNYCGYKSADGRFYVIGDTETDLQNPDAFIGGKPAREVFNGFTLMQAK